MREPRATLLKEFGDPTLRAIATTVFEASADAEQHCQSAYSEVMGAQLLPHERNVRVADRLMELMGRFPHVRATYRLNAARNHHHVVLSTEHAIMTVHGVTHPGERVREAVYRNRYAEWQQPHLFSATPPPETDDLDAAKTYAQVVYSADPNSLVYPGYLVVRFPSVAGDVAIPIDLLARFADLRPMPYLTPAAIVDRPVVRGLRVRKEDERS